METYRAAVIAQSGTGIIGNKNVTLHSLELREWILADRFCSISDPGYPIFIVVIPPQRIQSVYSKHLR